MQNAKQSFARYLPVNEQALLWELYCKDAGFTHIKPGSDYPPHSAIHPQSYADNVKSGRILREYQVIYITSGSGWYKNSIIGKQEIKAGDVIILFPGTLHSYSPHKETGWQEYWVGFNGKHAQRLQNKGIFSPSRPIHHIGLDASLTADFEQIIQLCRQQAPGFQVILGVLILQILAHIHVFENNPRPHHMEQDLVAKVIGIMEYHVEDGIDTDAIANDLNINYQYLLKLFKKQTGLTPYQYFLQLRIARAQDLLSHTDLSIKEIAAHLKFDNQYYFSRIFKKKTGITPSAWKAEA